MQYTYCDQLSLKEDGITVINDVLNDDEIDYAKNMMWDYLSHITKHMPIPIDKLQTDTYKSFYNLYPKHGMLLQNWDVGHNPMSWYVRQNAKVVDAFKSIWNTGDLLTSFDGLSISLPPEYTNRGWYANKDWLHTDQSYLASGFQCVQGLVNLYNVDDGDATLRVLQKSHNFQTTFRDTFNITNKSDWYKLNDTEKQFYMDKGCTDICVKAKAGSLILWDSRTIHQGIEPQKKRSRPNIRCALYVCMEPKSKATSRQVEKKKNAFLQRRTTNHSVKCKLFPKRPYTYGAPLYEVDPVLVEETDFMRKLSGF